MLGCRRKHQYPSSVSGQLLKRSATSRTASLISSVRGSLRLNSAAGFLRNPPRIPTRDAVGMFLNLPVFFFFKL